MVKNNATASVSEGLFRVTPANFGNVVAHQVPHDDETMTRVTKKTPRNWNTYVCKQISKLLASYRRAQQDLLAEDEQDALADCSGDELGEPLANSDIDESRDALADCSGDEMNHKQEESSDDEDDEELRNLMKKKETLEDEKQRLQSERQQRRALKEQRKRQLMAEVQDLEEEIKELSVGPYLPGYRR